MNDDELRMLGEMALEDTGDAVSALALLRECGYGAQTRAMAVRLARAHHPQSNRPSKRLGVVRLIRKPSAFP